MLPKMLFAILISISFDANSAVRIPLWSISKISPDDNSPVNIQSTKGFVLKELETSWNAAPPPADSKNLELLFRAPQVNKGTQAVLTIRYDSKLGKGALKNYIKKWARDYPQFGYNVLGYKGFKQNENVGYLIDVYNPSSEKQIRQVIFKKGEKAVIFTCVDAKSNFKSSLKECNNIVKTFTWN